MKLLLHRSTRRSSGVTGLAGQLSSALTPPTGRPDTRGMSHTTRSCCGRRGRDADSHLKENALTQFSDLGLAGSLLRALEHEGYETPTPIQAKAIPPLLQGRDLLGIAQTGTGKTAAFALPIIQKLTGKPRAPVAMQPRVLVLAPTRELATQIAESFRAYSRFARVSVAVVIGGVSMGPQIQALARGVDVLVATPGRLLDLMQQRRIRLDQTEVVVLDEADHMLDLGFIVPIRQIVAKLPKERQNLFFSATMPKEIASLASDFLRDPVQVAVTPVATTAERVNQSVILCDTSAKRDLLASLFADPALGRAIVFTRTKRGADKVAQHLEAGGVSAGAIHGNKSQNHRQRTLDQFRAGRTRVLVATDIAARGIDVDGVTHVINFELPEVAEAYVHRIGRTARAGAAGAAISFCDNSERDLLRAIEKLTRQSLPTTDRRGNPGEVAAPSQRPDARRQRGRSNGGHPPQRDARPHGEHRPQRDSRPQGSPRPHADARPQADNRPMADHRPKADNRPRNDNRPKSDARPQGDAKRPAQGRPFHGNRGQA